MTISYTKSEGVSIGYSVSGSGDQCLIYVPGAYSNLAMERYIPESVAWEKFLEKFGRIITFDKRASGVSDRTTRPLNLDQQVVDVEAVRAAAEAEDLIVCGMSQGAPLAVLYALAYPERTRALILLEGVCCDAADPFADLSDKNTLFDWERSLAKFDSDFTAWCLDFCNLLAPNQSEEDLDLNVEYMLSGHWMSAFSALIDLVHPDVRFRGESRPDRQPLRTSAFSHKRTFKRSGEQERARCKPPESLDTWDLYLRGQTAFLSRVRITSVWRAAMPAA